MVAVAVAVQSRGRKGVLGIGQPIEVGLGADHDAWPELPINANLATAEELVAGRTVKDACGTSESEKVLELLKAAPTLPPR